MPDLELEELLSGAVNSVLETMFFTAVGREQEPEESPAIAAHLSFRGNPSGDMVISLSMAAASPIAAGFLGVDEADLTEAQAGEVLCEMANMLCGWVISKIETKTSFDLAPQRLVPPENVWLDGAEGQKWARRGFPLEHGVLVVALHLLPMKAGSLESAG
jgi:CheY-specific phosphatase CheX